MMLLLVILLVLAAPEALGADESNETDPTSYAATLCVNFIPDLTYLTPVFSASLGRAYVEARYQYEDLATASLWAGPAFEGGEAFEWWISPVAGVVFGRTSGLAPGIEVDLAWRRFSFSTATQYLFDLAGEDASYFYSWTEWIYNAHDLFAPGITIERTRVRGENRDINTGITVYSHVRRLSFSFYAFNPWDSEYDYYVAGVGTEF